MGAQSFSNLVVVKGDAGDAYSKACAEMRDYNGHREGYSGDIQTTHGIKSPRGKVPRFGTKAFDKWEGKCFNNGEVQKWEEAMCVEVTGAVATRIKHRHGYKGRKGIRVFYFFGYGAC